MFTFCHRKGGTMSRTVRDLQNLQFRTSFQLKYSRRVDSNSVQEKIVINKDFRKYRNKQLIKSDQKGLVLIYY